MPIWKWNINSSLSSPLKFLEDILVTTRALRQKGIVNSPTDGEGLTLKLRNILTQWALLCAIRKWLKFLILRTSARNQTRDAKKKLRSLRLNVLQNYLSCQILRTWMCCLKNSKTFHSPNKNTTCFARSVRYIFNHSFIISFIRSFIELEVIVKTTMSMCGKLSASCCRWSFCFPSAKNDNSL